MAISLLQGNSASALLIELMLNCFVRVIVVVAKVRLNAACLVSDTNFEYGECRSRIGFGAHELYHLTRDSLYGSSTAKYQTSYQLGTKYRFQIKEKLFNIF